MADCGLCKCDEPTCCCRLLMRIAGRSSSGCSKVCHQVSTQHASGPNFDSAEAQSHLQRTASVQSFSRDESTALMTTVAPWSRKLAYMMCDTVFLDSYELRRSRSKTGC